MAPCEARHRSAGTSIMVFPASETLRNKCLLFIPSLRYSVTAARTKTMHIKHLGQCLAHNKCSLSGISIYQAGKPVHRPWNQPNSFSLACLLLQVAAPEMLRTQSALRMVHPPVLPCSPRGLEPTCVFHLGSHLNDSGDLLFLGGVYHHHCAARHADDTAQLPQQVQTLSQEIGGKDGTARGNGRRNAG